MTELDVPPQLRDMRRWIVWRYEDGRKVPWRCNTAAQLRASTTDETHWGMLEAALWSTANGLFSLGYVFAEGDGLVGIDLDDCFVDWSKTDMPQLGMGQPFALKPWAQPLESALLQTYCEVSPSGTGLKAWCYGSIPKAVKKVIDWGGNGAIEMYSKGRYFAFTGNRYKTAPLEVTDMQDQLVSYLYDRLTTRPLGDYEYPAKFTHGTQHNELTRVLGVLRRHNLCEEAIEACLLAVNQHQCEQPGPSENILRMIASSKEWNQRR